jgi:hypothetical protein
MTWPNGTGEIMLRSSSSITSPVSRLVVSKGVGQRGRIRRSTQARRGVTMAMAMVPTSPLTPTFGGR